MEQTKSLCRRLETIDKTLGTIDILPLTPRERKDIPYALEKDLITAHENLRKAHLSVRTLVEHCDVKGLKQDPILAEVTRQICSTGVCLAEPKKKGKLPLCTPSQAKSLERCILDVKAKMPSSCKPHWSKPASKQPEGCVNPFSVCRSSLGCRLGGRKEKVR